MCTSVVFGGHEGAAPARSVPSRCVLPVVCLFQDFFVVCYNSMDTREDARVLYTYFIPHIIYDCSTEVYVQRVINSRCISRCCKAFYIIFYIYYKALQITGRTVQTVVDTDFTVCRPGDGSRLGLGYPIGSKAANSFLLLTC